MRVLNALVFQLFALFLIFTQNLTKIESFYSYMKIKFFHQKTKRKKIAELLITNSLLSECGGKLVRHQNDCDNI
jgi:hypothetical protein